MQAPLEQNEQLAARVVRAGAHEIDKHGAGYRSPCACKLLLKQQPVASDLRDISAALKMISDMERIGDQASDIADLYRLYQPVRWIRPPLTCGKWHRRAVKMVNESIDAFVRRDLVMAREVIAYDDVVDRWFEQHQDAI